MWSSILLAVALSMDGFLVGISYGIRKIRIPTQSLLIVAGCTAVGMGGSMVLGHVVNQWAQLQAAQVIGGVLLIILGVWQLMQGWSEYLARNVRWGPVVQLHIRSLGLVVQVLSEPSRADRDLSGEIDTREAVVLGAALGLDTLGAGFAAAILGYGYSLVVLVTLAIIGLTWGGLSIGSSWGPKLLGERGVFVPGILLIIVGLLQL